MHLLVQPNRYFLNASRVPGAALGHRDTAEGNREASSWGDSQCVEGSGKEERQGMKRKFLPCCNAPCGFPGRVKLCPSQPHLTIALLRAECTVYQGQFWF